MRWSRRQWLIASAAAISAAAGGVLIRRKWLPGEPDAADRLRTMSLPDLDGKPQALHQWRDKLLVLNFWATWCEPCRDEIPALVAAQTAYAKSVQIVGISVDSTDKIRQFIEPFKINYPLLIANLGTLEWMRELGNKSGALPYTVFVTGGNIIVSRHLGALTQSQLEAGFKKWTGQAS